MKKKVFSNYSVLKIIFFKLNQNNNIILQFFLQF